MCTHDGHNASTAQLVLEASHHGEVMGYPPRIAPDQIFLALTVVILPLLDKPQDMNNCDDHDDVVNL